MMKNKSNENVFRNVLIIFSLANNSHKKINAINNRICIEKTNIFSFFLFFKYFNRSLLYDI